MAENEQDNEAHVTQPPDPRPDQLIEEHNMAVDETSVTSLSSEVKEDVPRITYTPPVQEENVVTSSQPNAQSEDTGVTDSTPANSLLTISHVPIMVAHAASDFTRSTLVNNFLKGCKWYDQD